MRETYAFSKLEISAVLLIIAAALPVSLPSLREATLTAALRSETTKLKLELQNAVLRTESLEHPQEIVVGKGSGNTKNTASSGTLTLNYTPRDGISIDHLPSDQKITFHPGGTCSPSRLRLSRSGAACDITISLRCRIRSLCS